MLFTASRVVLPGVPWVALCATARRCVTCTAGDLVITMPKEHPNLRLAKRLKERQREEEEEKKRQAEERKAARRAKLPQKVGDAVSL